MHPTPESLNAFVDATCRVRLQPDRGELTEADRLDIERHLETCADCRGIAGGLQDVKQAAAALGPIVPPSHVWARINGASRRVGPRRPDLYWPLATAAVLFLATLAGVRFGPMAPRLDAPPAQVSPAGDTSSAMRAPLSNEDLELADRQYQAAIGELEDAAAAGRDVLDRDTIDTLWTTLADVDRAIDESREALAVEPDSRTAQDSLIGGLKTKLAVLEDTIALITLTEG